MTETPTPGAAGGGPGNRHLVGGAAAACAVCCAAPVVGFVGVAGFAATAVTLAFAGVVFALVVGLVAAATVITRRTRSRQTTCAPQAGSTAGGTVPVKLGPRRTTDDT